MIKDKFNGCTILTIAHRLETVADYDAIIVMDKVINKYHIYKYIIYILYKLGIIG
jgi:ATP-binding cassette subfamily C (CFTR/MRP) protein 4